MIRRITAVVAGLAVAVITIMAIQKIGHYLYPPPESLDVADQEFMRNYVVNLPWGPLAIVIASYFFATLIGGWICAVIAPERPLVYAMIVGAAVMAGMISTVTMIPHPTWFVASAVIGIVLAVWLAASLASSMGGNRRAV